MDASADRKAKCAVHGEPLDLMVRENKTFVCDTCKKDGMKTYKFSAFLQKFNEDFKWWSAQHGYDIRNEVVKNEMESKFLLSSYYLQLRYFRCLNHRRLNTFITENKYFWCSLMNGLFFKEQDFLELVVKLDQQGVGIRDDNFTLPNGTITPDSVACNADALQNYIQ